MMQANTGVRFETKDPLLSQLVKQAEEKCRLNIKNFGGDPVLVEGGGYEKIWLETQPMGGAMYASHDFATGLNNSLMFMRHQRADGRIPGSIAVIDGKVVPQFNKFQGFCFPEPALDLYYLGGKDAEYLAQLAKTLEAFDAYLWRVRDSDGDGCLETWCKYDTGEDHAMRYADAPDPWEEETPPQGCTAVPIASMDVMSYSYACRETLAEIARISGDAEAQAQWAAKAKAVQDKMVSYLWDDARGAMFDRDKNHNQMLTLIHNTLRCMYWHSLPDALAERFVKEHLLNPQEFWTKMPLPSVAANDPLFRNVTTNNWSGQAEALTYQRAIRALENYDMYELIPQLGQKLMQAIGPQCRFVQQYDPFTGEPSVICEPGQPPPGCLRPGYALGAGIHRPHVRRKPGAGYRGVGHLPAGMPLYPSPERPQLGDREQWSRGGSLCGWPQGVHRWPRPAHYHRPGWQYSGHGPLPAGCRPRPGDAAINII